MSIALASPGDARAAALLRAVLGAGLNAPVPHAVRVQLHRGDERARPRDTSEWRCARGFVVLRERERAVHG